MYKTRNTIDYSVIMPVYNREDIVDNAIKSIINQKYNGSWELIIIDDGSTDGSLTKLHSYQKDNINIKVIHQENKGVSAARNVGLDQAKGKYILFLDSDDIMVDDAFRCINDSIQRFNANIDLIVFGIKGGWKPDISDHMVLKSKGELRGHYLKEHINLEPQTQRYFTQPYIWNKCFSRQLLEKNNIKFDEARKTWEDNVFLVECLDKAENMLMISKELYINCPVTEGIKHLSHEFYPEMIDQYLMRYAENKERFGEEFEFDNQYTMRRYYDVTSMLLKDGIKTDYGKELFIKTMNNPIMKHIIDILKPANRDELSLKKSIGRKDFDVAYDIFTKISEKNSANSEKSFYSRIKNRVRAIICRS